MKKMYVLVELHELSDQWEAMYDKEIIGLFDSMEKVKVEIEKFVKVSKNSYSDGEKLYFGTTPFEIVKVNLNSLKRKSKIISAFYQVEYDENGNYDKNLTIDNLKLKTIEY